MMTFQTRWINQDRDLILLNFPIEVEHKLHYRLSEEIDLFIKITN